MVVAVKILFNGLYSGMWSRSRNFIFQWGVVLFSQKKNLFKLQKNNYEILIYYVDTSFVQEIWKDTGYRI
jgi:hypothetical protein